MYREREKKQAAHGSLLQEGQNEASDTMLSFQLFLLLPDWATSLLFFLAETSQQVDQEHGGKQQASGE